LFFKRWNIVFLILLVSACSTTRKLVSTPNIYRGNGKFPKTRNSELKPQIIYVTDRNSFKDGEKLKYDAKRSRSLAYGKATVEFSGAENWSDLVQASQSSKRDNNIEVKLLKIDEISTFPETPILFEKKNGKLVENKLVKKEQLLQKYKFSKIIKAELKKAKSNEVILYIHGFNVLFNDAILDLSELWHFTGRHGVPIAYSWPAGTGGLFGYFTDRESGEFTIFHLKEFLKVLRDIKEIKKLHIVAHSRGCDVMTSALRELIIESLASGKKPLQEYRIKNLILAAPDLDFEIVGQRLIAEKFAQGFGQITIYMNKEDGALGISQSLMSGTRFGKLQKENLNDNERNIFKSLKTVNFINVKGTKSFFGHSYFREHPGAISDIIRVIKSENFPGSMLRPLDRKAHNFWTIEKDYLLNESNNK